MSTLLIVHFTQKGFEVCHCCGPIQIRPHGAVLWSVKKPGVKNEQKSYLDLQNQKP